MDKTTRLPRFDREWNDMLNLLPQDRRTALYEAIRHYQTDGIEPSGLKEAELMAFLLIKKSVDRRAKLREARRRKREAAIAAGQAGPKQTDVQKVPDTADTPKEKDSGSGRHIVNGIDMNPDLIERDEKGVIIIRSSEDMIRCIHNDRMTRRDPTKRTVYRFVGK